MFNNCSNLEKVCTKGWLIDDTYRNLGGNMINNINNIVSNTKLKEIDLSFITINYTQNKQTHATTTTSTFASVPTTLTYVKYGSGWFNATLHNIAKTYICTSVNLTKKHYDDMIEDLPDLNGVEISNDSYKTLTIGENFDDWEKLPQSSRDKIHAKKWLISKQ